MSDAQTIYEFRLACHKPGCPVCTIVQRAGARYIEGTFNESMLDLGVRQKLVDSLGFCYEHTMHSIDLKLSDALGHAILYQSLIKKTMNSILENEKNTGRQLATALEPSEPCPVCRIEGATLERVVDSISSSLRDQDFLAEFNQSDGLCIPHLKRLISKLDGKRQAAVLDHQYERMVSLEGELAEFIRKSDYRFRDEAIGREGDSYKRAADMINGKHRPVEKKDLR
jgi:hypothetical protein